MLYEFYDFGRDKADADVSERDLKSDSAARSHAGAIAKKNGGPVDLVRGGGEPWDVRYMTTAMPSEHHASGYRCERLTG